VRRSLAHIGDDIAQGFFEITHSGFAMLGLVVAFVMITLLVRPDLRDAAEARLMEFLLERQEAVIALVEPNAAARVSAMNPKDLPKDQAAVTHWISRKYGVAPEPVAALVSSSYKLGAKVKLDPTLILAIMAIESSFNPFAQSPMGAQGLMQVMTGIHQDKYKNFGGRHAAFDPLSNLRVGIQVLQDCIQRAGSVEGGLRFYVGAANLDNDGGYTAKVMAEHERLRQVALGMAIPTQSAPVPVAAPPARPAAKTPEQVALLSHP
jgi:hypothetical protein